MANNSNLASANSARPSTPRTPTADAPQRPSPNPQDPSRPAPNEEAIRTRAYDLWERAGRPECDGTQFWFEAERELNAPR